MESNLILNPNRRKYSLPQTVEVADRYVITTLPADEHYIIAINDLIKKVK